MKRHAQEAWEIWFKAFFQVIEENPDVVKAFSYINCHWLNHPMWKDNPVFQNIDARLQTNPTIIKKWNDKLTDDRYLLAEDQIWDLLWSTENAAHLY